MALATYLLDASALVDWLKGKPAAGRLVESLADAGHVLAVNVISLAEVYAGLSEDEWPPVDAALEPLDYWEMDASTAKLAGAYRYAYARRGQPLSAPDTLMAAHAISSGATLLTGNITDFPMPELQLMELPPD